ncbi:MAG: thermonuclease family protein [Thermoproteota archaeon]|nr:thermonuclease family protein [Thermoproteota archaeon]
MDRELAKIPPESQYDSARNVVYYRIYSNLCLGSTVLVDEDDMLSTSDSDIVGVVYCSSTNLNSELLDNGYAELDTEQCATSEFADESWAKDRDC